MATFNTVPAEDTLLLGKKADTKTSWKGLVAGAAMASLILGLLTATTVTRHTVATLGWWLCDSAFIIQGCQPFDDFEHVQYNPNGPAGAGWYCADNKPWEDFSLTTETSIGHEVTDWGARQYTAWYYYGPQGRRIQGKQDYEEAHIHRGCDAASYDTSAKIYKCLDDDDFTADKLSPADFAYQATRSAVATYSGSQDPLFGDGGYLRHELDHFVWNIDGDPHETVKYGYENGSHDSSHAYKLYKKDVPDAPGFYKVYNECMDGCGDGGKKCCWLNFYCINSFTDELYHDC